MSISLKRAAVGRIAALGDFYDARRDVFLPVNIFKGTLPSNVVTVQKLNSRNQKTLFPKTLKDKLEIVEAGDDLSLSILSGMVEFKGSAEILDNHGEPSRVECLLHQRISISLENCDFRNLAVGEHVETDRLTDMVGTHVVVGIERGCKTILSISCEVGTNQTEEQVQNLIASSIESGVAHQDLVGLQVGIYSDVPQSLSGDATIAWGKETLAKIAVETKEGVPLTYVLVSIEDAAVMLEMENLQWKTLFCPIRSKPAKKAIAAICENIERLRQIEILRNKIHKNRDLLPPDRVDAVLEKHREAALSSRETNKNGAVLFQQLRLNWDENIDTFYDDFLPLLGEGPLSSSQTRTFFEKNADLSQHVDLLEGLKRNGAVLIKDLAEYEKLKKTTNFYILFYSMKLYSHPLWKATLQRFFQLSSERREHGTVLVAMDVEILKEVEATETPRIAFVKHKKYEVKDLLAYEKRIRECNFVFATEPFDTNHDVNRKNLVLAKISCPGERCKRESVEWCCAKCTCVMEYDLKGNLYCRCGRLPATSFHFRCGDALHGEVPIPYQSQKLFSELGKIQPYKQVNILVIGETGVGKSTWINALPSYIRHSNLKDAEEFPLEYVIPFQFSMNVPKPGRVEMTEVKYGESSNEVYAPRKSVTQDPRCYYFKHDSTLYCVIDTPGIGDCDGPDKDKRNMKKIVNFICQFGNIHLICFLMSTNQSRLTKTFEFCFNELISHFHRSAVGNIAFCITRASGNNFQIGDSYPTLQTLVNDIKEKRRDIDIPLGDENIFIFDNVAFLHVAASQQGVAMNSDQIGTAEKSFDVTRKATLRMMRNASIHCPYNAEESLGINFIRTTILEISKPLADIGIQIQRTIGEIREFIDELKMNELNESELRKTLTKTVTFHTYKFVEENVTLCKKCMRSQEVRGEDRIPYIKANPLLVEKEMITITVGDPIPKGDPCKNCGPKFKKFKSKTRYYKNEGRRFEIVPKVMKEINNSKEARDLIETIIVENTAKMHALNDEKKKITKACTAFAHFLNNNSIVPYNDATKAYLELLMEAEKQYRGITKAYMMFANLLDEYEKEKAIFESLMRINHSGDVSVTKVVELLTELKQMPHYGKQIRDAVVAVVPSYDEKAINGRSFVRMYPSLPRQKD